MSHNNLGWLFHSTGRLEKALPAYNDAVAFQRQQVADHPDVPEFQLELGKYLINLGNALRDAGRTGRSRNDTRRGPGRLQTTCRRIPQRADFRKELANVEGLNSSSLPEGKPKR
jgi:hypothetical protein